MVDTAGRVRSPRIEHLERLLEEQDAKQMLSTLCDGRKSQC